jgi:hypothetical protein
MCPARCRCQSASVVRHSTANISCSWHHLLPRYATVATVATITFVKEQDLYQFCRCLVRGLLRHSYPGSLKLVTSQLVTRSSLDFRRLLSRFQGSLSRLYLAYAEIFRTNFLGKQCPLNDAVNIMKSISGWANDSTTGKNVNP